MLMARGNAFSRNGHRPTLRAGRVRPGTVTVEFLLNLPVWLILLLAMVHFGRLLANSQQLALASRVGAREAARTAHLPCSGGVPEHVVRAVGRQLQDSGIACTKVILEHNVGGAHARLESGTGPGTPPHVPLPILGRYVRVTVFSHSRSHSTTFRHEGDSESR